MEQPVNWLEHWLKPALERKITLRYKLTLTRMIFRLELVRDTAVRRQEWLPATNFLEAQEGNASEGYRHRKDCKHS